MAEKQVSFQSQARYFTMGALNASTKNVWMICHGYGQTVPYFKRKFQPLADAGHFLIFPEGLHNFYHDIKGKRTPVASWMTSENREMAIANYLTYINTVFEQECPKAEDKEKLISLGFSQGSNTIIRWLIYGNHSSNHTYICGGSLPRDLDFQKYREDLNRLNLRYFYGSDDQFAKAAHIEKEQSILDENKISHKMISFEGTHTVPVDLLCKDILSLQ